MATAVEEPRTYGGWRQSRGLGVFGLSGPETAVVGTAIFLLLGSLGWARQFLLPAAIFTVVTIALVARIEGHALWTLLWSETSWLLRGKRGRGTFRSPLIMFDDGTRETLPGPLAPTRMYTVDVAGHDRYGALYNTASRLVTVSFAGHAQTVGLADPGETDVWVANWSAFLAALPDMPQVSFVSVTVATSTDPSPRVEQNLARMKAATAPDLSSKIMSDVADRFTAGTQRTRTIISVTFDPRWGEAGWSRSPERLIPDLHGNVMAIGQSLERCGLTSMRAMTPEEVAGEVRSAMSPDVAGDGFEALNDEEARPTLRWDLSGPSSMDEHRSYVEHDAYRTQAWALTIPPREVVTATVMHRMMQPSRFTKRVTFLWHPLPAAKAQRLLEGQRFLADVKRRLAKSHQAHETARELLDREVADQAARQEAEGAGYGTFTIFAAITMPSPTGLNAQQERQLLKAAELDLIGSASGSRLTLRRLDKTHGIGFMGTLPAGINPATSLVPR